MKLLYVIFLNLLSLCGISSPFFISDCDDSGLNRASLKMTSERFWYPVEWGEGIEIIGAFKKRRFRFGRSILKLREFDITRQQENPVRSKVLRV